MNKREDLLFELGVEELPARLIEPLLESLKEGLTAALAASQLAHEEVSGYATPRRLAVLVRGLTTRQPDTTQDRIGPWMLQAYDAEGKPTPALSGFARSAGVAPEMLEVVKQDGKERLVARINNPGKPTLELLPALLVNTINDMKPQASMRWGDGSRSFTRPVRWVTARFGGERVDCACFGMQAIGHSYGHRFAAPGKVALKKKPVDYAASLKKAWVFVDAVERRATISSEIDAAAKKLDCRSLASDWLVDELCGLVEYPRIMVGRLDERFLRLPREVLITTLVSHQRYIGLEDSQGDLAPHFLFVTNMPQTGEVDDQAIVLGNERVLIPRLEDATFFWDKDCTAGLDVYADALHQVVFETRLGTMADKSARLEALVVDFAELITEANKSALIKAASLCKADLVSELVGEFPELQGVIGGHLARRQGLPMLTAEAIAEHYYPRGAEDRLPNSLEGVLLALADKLDHLCGLFVVGKQGSAEADPFGARRACLGVIQLLFKLEGIGGVRELIALGFKRYHLENTELHQALFGFFTERLVHWYQRLGLGITPVQAVLARGLDNLGEIDRRVRFLARHQDQFGALAQLIKRIRNLLKDGRTDDETINPELFDHQQERELHEGFTTTAPQARAMLVAGDYAGYVKICSSLTEPLAALFDGVMIKSGDESKQRNRLALLAEVEALCCELGDVTKL